MQEGLEFIKDDQRRASVREFVSGFWRFPEFQGELFIGDLILGIINNCFLISGKTGFRSRWNDGSQFRRRHGYRCSRGCTRIQVFYFIVVFSLHL